jgi:hypothetical protein
MRNQTPWPHACRTPSLLARRRRLSCAARCAAATACSPTSTPPSLTRTRTAPPSPGPAAEVDDQLFVGAALLVSPVVEPGARRRTVYFSAGPWFDLATGARLLRPGGGGAREAGGGGGGGRVTLDAPLWHIPVRGGHVVPAQRAGRTAVVVRRSPVTLLAAPDAAGRAAGALHLDDGKSPPPLSTAAAAATSRSLSPPPATTVVRPGGGPGSTAGRCATPRCGSWRASPWARSLPSSRPGRPCRRGRRGWTGPASASTTGRTVVFRAPYRRRRGIGPTRYATMELPRVARPEGCCGMTDHLCEDYGLGSPGQAWAVPGRTEHTLHRRLDTQSATGRTPQRTAGIGTHQGPGRERAAGCHGPPAGDPSGPGP